MIEKKKYSLALGGGGAKGFAHIGVLKALEELNIEITHIGGTSVGSLIGCMYCLWKDISRIERIAMELDGEELKNLATEYIKFNKKTEVKDPVLYIIDKYIGNSTFEDCILPFVVVTIDLNTGEKVFHTSGSLKHVIRASCSVPFLFGSHEYDSMNLVDGGFADSVPTEAVRSIGGEKIIGVQLESYLPKKYEKKTFSNIQSQAYQSFIYNVAKEDMYLADKKIEFNLERYTVSELIEKRKMIIDVGYQETMRVMKS